jgi:outer membrane protein assembly factor BamB
MTQSRPKEFGSALCRLRVRVAASVVAAAGICWHASVQADDWPQWLGPQRDSVWRESGIIEKFPEGGPTVRWRTPVGAGYTGPSVAAGRVVLMDRVTPDRKLDQPTYKRASKAGKERVLCLNEADGKVIWKHEYDCTYTVDRPSGPRTSPVIHQGKVYTLGTEGNLFCFDFESGKVLWSHDFKNEYEARTPMWGYSAHLLVDGQKLISLVGVDGNAVVAFDKDSGKEIWRSLSVKETGHGPGYCPPMIYEAGGKRQLIVWHPDSINSLDPETGKPYWSQPFEIKAGLTIPTPRKLGNLLFVTSFYNGPMMMKLDSDKPAASLLWRGKSSQETRTDKLHAIMCTPVLEEGYIYGVCSYGQLRCLKADTGERVWESVQATGSTGDTSRQSDRWKNAFIVKNGDRFFLANELGDLIIAKLSPKGYQEISRTHLLDPTTPEAGRPVVWSHPAFANKSVYMRNDKEIICVSLASDAAARP